MNNMKTAMHNDLNLDAMVSMKREDLGKLFASKDGLIQAVAPMKNPVHEPAREIEEPVRNMRGMAMG